MKNNKEPILNRLKEERVLDVYRSGNKIYFTEMCDQYFRISLTKEEMYKLIEELRYLTDNMKE